MLVEFSVKNYRSFWETQTLNMSATSHKELQKKNSFSSPVQGMPRLLRSAVVYGPNGGGKSNLIKALSFMQNFVLSSSKDSQEGERIDCPPFILNTFGTDQAGEFEIVCIQDGVRYQYGFEVTRERVTHEWLFAYPTGKAQRWFERSFNQEKLNEECFFGGKFFVSKKTWQENTRKNALFLSTAIQLNSEQLQSVFHWFTKLLILEHGALISPSYSANHCEDKKCYGDILGFLQDASIEVDGIDIKEKEFNPQSLPNDMPEELKIAIQTYITGQK